MNGGDRWIPRTQTGSRDVKKNNDTLAAIIFLDSRDLGREKTDHLHRESGASACETDWTAQAYSEPRSATHIPTQGVYPHRGALCP